MTRRIRVMSRELAALLRLANGAKRKSTNKCPNCSIILIHWDTVNNCSACGQDLNPEKERRIRIKEEKALADEIVTASVSKSQSKYKENKEVRND